MNQVYLSFYKQKTNQLAIEEMGRIDLEQYPFLVFDGTHYKLKPNILIGSLDHKKSFGFLRLTGDDLYIEGNNLKDAMHDDIVLVKNGYEPEVVLVLERKLKTIVATIKKRHKELYFYTDVPLDRKLVVNYDMPLVAGQVVKLTVETITKDEVKAHVRRVIGHENDPDIETLKIVAKYDWPTKFKDDILDEIKTINQDLDQELKTRLDLRDELIITIDGADAKDLDDAISLRYEDNKYHVGVHIADVSRFVKENSLLDQEALLRGTSVYLADRVIPMLPHVLSNDWCSLNPHEAKLTLSCMMVLDSEGKVESYDIKKTVIESKMRLTYDAVNLLIHEEKTVGNQAVDQMLHQMHQLSLILQKQRRARGEIEFDSTEIGFKVDKNGKVLDVYKRKTDEAEQLIESFMLLANETVAFHLHHADLPALYRIHETPDVDKMKDALTQVSRLGFKVNFKQLTSPKTLQKITKESQTSMFHDVVHMLILRAMQKAKYSEKSLGHYGLGARYYLHFTSPIRRYPDLIVHRVIHKLVLGETNNYKKTFNDLQANMPSLGLRTSESERTAIQIERDVNQLKSCEYMQDKIGKTFTGNITTMLKSGMFVRLDNGIEGFISLRSFNEYLTYDEMNLSFISDHGAKYQLGQQVKIRVADVDMMNHLIDFEIVTKPKKKRR